MELYPFDLLPSHSNELIMSDLFPTCNSDVATPAHTTHNPTMARRIAALATLTPLLLLLRAALAQDQERASADGFSIWGYLPEYRTANFDYEGAFQTGLTHLIYFSVEVRANGAMHAATWRCTMHGMPS